MSRWPILSSMLAMALFLRFDKLDVVGLLTIPLLVIAVLGLLFWFLAMNEEFVEL